MKSVRNAAAALVLVSGLMACADDADDVGSVGPPSPEAVAEADYFLDPASYAGQRVRVVGEVDTILHNDAFTLIPQVDAVAEKAPDKLLVLHTGDLNVAAGSPIAVTGTTHPDFGPAQARPFAEQFAEDPAFDPFLGRPYLEADGLDRNPDEEG